MFGGTFQESRSDGGLIKWEWLNREAPVSRNLDRMEAWSGWIEKYWCLIEFCIILLEAKMKIIENYEALISFSITLLGLGGKRNVNLGRFLFHPFLFISFLFFSPRNSQLFLFLFYSFIFAFVFCSPSQGIKACLDGEMDWDINILIRSVLNWNWNRFWILKKIVWIKCQRIKIFSFFREIDIKLKLFVL